MIFKNLTSWKRAHKEYLEYPFYEKKRPWNNFDIAFEVQNLWNGVILYLLLLFTIFDGLLFLSESKIGFSIYLKYSDTSYYMGLNVGVNSVFDVKQVVESKPLAFTNGF